MMQQTCEWCGQPASTTNPALCAECHYKYWQKTRFFGSSDDLPEYSALAGASSRD